jgi:ATP-binding cassette subfamily B protein
MQRIIHTAQTHFMVVYAFGEKSVYIADPMKGKIKLADKDFIQSWYEADTQMGKVLLVQPGPNFNILSEGERLDRRKSWESIFSYFKPYTKSFINLFVIMLVVTGLQALLPFLSKAVIDVGIQTQDLRFVNIVLIGNIAIILSVTLANVVRDWILLHIASRINISLVSD